MAYTMRLLLRFSLARVSRRIPILVCLALAMSIVPFGYGTQGTATPAPPSGQAQPATQAAPVPQKAQAPEPPPIDQGLLRVQSAVAAIKAPEPRAVAATLGVELRKEAGTSCTAAGSQLQEVGALEGGRLPQLVLIRRLSEADPESGPQPSASWGLFLLAWDGAGWKASRLGVITESCQVQVIQLARRRRAIAVVTPREEDDLLYPAIYGLKGHEAALLWDGQSESSLFHAEAKSAIEFRQVGGVAQMIVRGRADPGLLDFAPNGRRGFEVTTEYHWDGRAYVPGQTQFSANPDYTLYQFIAALHLHDFHAAYALVDPTKFMHAEGPTVDTFRQYVQKNWPEFLDDQIFVARETRTTPADEFAFTLPAKHYIYRPAFSADGKHLTGLVRETEAATDNP